MEWTTIERTEELIEGVLRDIDDDEHRFKLRTALQSLEIIEEQHEATNQALADSDLNEQTRKNLQELGHLE